MKIKLILFSFIALSSFLFSQDIKEIVVNFDQLKQEIRDLNDLIETNQSKDLIDSQALKIQEKTDAISEMLYPFSKEYRDKTSKAALYYALGTLDKAYESMYQVFAIQSLEDIPPYKLNVSYYISERIDNLMSKILECSDTDKLKRYQKRVNSNVKEIKI